MVPGLVQALGVMGGEFYVSLCMIIAVFCVVVGGECRVLCGEGGVSCVEFGLVESVWLDVFHPQVYASPGILQHSLLQNMQV